MAKVIVNRNGYEKYDIAIEKLKKQFGEKSATKAVEKAIVYMVNEKPNLDKELSKTKQELKETKYLFDRLISKIKLKQDAEDSINQILNMV